MANSNTSVSIKTSANTVITINTKEVTSMKLSTIKAELTAQFTFEKKVVVGVEKNRVAGKRGKAHAKAKTKIKRTPIYATKQVVDVAALNRAAKLVLAEKLAEAKEAAKAAFHARNQERSEAKAFAMAQAAVRAELALIEQQLAKAKSLNPRRVTTRRPITKAMVIKTRTTQKPARIRVPHNPLVFTGDVAPVAIPHREIRVSRAEAQAILRSVSERPFSGGSVSTMEVIAAFNRVDSLIAVAIKAITTVGGFMAQAQSIMNNTKNSLPAVAQAMTMSANENSIRLDNLLSTSQEDAIKFFNQEANMLEDLAKIAAEDGEDQADALSNEIYDWNKDHTVADLTLLVIAQDYVEGYIHSGGYQEWADALDMTISEYISSGNYDESCFPFGRENMSNDGLTIDRPVANRGDGNLSKNVTVSEDPSDVTPVNNTNDSLETMTHINASAFASAFDADYSEVAPLINFGAANSIINFNGEGQSFAEVLAGVVYNTKELVKPGKRETEADVAESNASIERQNARALENRAQFLEAYGDKLGHIGSFTATYGARGSYDKSTPALKQHFEKLFTMAKLPVVKTAEIQYSGLPLDPNAPTFPLVDAASLWLGILARATYNLTVEERAKLLGILFHNVASVEGTKVTRSNVTIDVANATISTGSRVLKANKASCFNGADFVVVDGCHAIFLFALQALGGTAKQLEVAINLAVKLFQPEHNYGHRPDHDDMAHFVRTNLIYSNAVKPVISAFPSIEIIGGKQAPEFLGWVLNRGVVATSDKTNVKFVTINAGAEAVGVGYSRNEFGGLDQMFTANDANKPTKLFNRPAANNYDCADLEDRVASNFGFQLSNGQVARTKGKMMKVAFTNSLLTFGSGVGILNLNSQFKFSIDKKEKESVNISLFGPQYLNNPEAKKAVIAKIETAIKALKGEIFEAGEVMLSIQEEGSEYNLVRNGEKAADVVVKGGFVRNNVLDENSIDISIEVALLGETGFVKTRRFATKFTTVPYAAEFIGHSEEWDIILNNECTKGHGALLEMFTNATGERFLNNSTQEFVTPEGDSFNVMSEDNPFYDWRNANIRKDVKLQMTIAKSVWENQARFCTNTVEVIAETTDFDGNPCVIVEETCDVIYGELVFDVEISSPLESVSKSNLTLESASAIYLQSKALGEALFNECIAKADKFVGLANRYASADVANMTVVDLEDDNSYNEFIDRLPALQNAEGGKLTQRNIISLLAVTFPEGVQFLVKGQDKALSLNFGVIASFGQFNAINGGAARETGDIMNFILDVLAFGAEDRKNLVTKARYSMVKILNTAVDSKKVLKKPTRAGNLVYGKVRTSFHPMLHSNDDIPTVVMNANCPMVKMLGIKPDGSILTHYVGFARTPMPFLGGARLKLTTDSSICAVAHVLVDPYVWHQLNEGDSDGDGIAILNLDKFGFTADQVRELNASIMGIAGYEHLYGDAVPFADFVSEEDKAGKKSFRGAMTLISTQVKNPDTGEKVNITADFAGNFAARVASHYKSAVGTSYGICSALVFKAADWSADPEEDITEVLTATLIAWRAMYEGLGLSGYSAKAARVFNIINLATMDMEGHKVLTAKSAGSSVACKWDKEFKTNHPDFVEVDGAEVILQEFPEFSHVSADVFDHIIEARCHTKIAVRLEGFGKELSDYHYSIHGLVDGAIKYGTLRRISQGDDRVANELTREEEANMYQNGEHVGIALTRRFDQKYGEMSRAFTNNALFNLTAKVCEFHCALLKTKANALAKEIQDMNS